MRNVFHAVAVLYFQLYKLLTLSKCTVSFGCDDTHTLNSSEQGDETFETLNSPLFSDV